MKVIEENDDIWFSDKSLVTKDDIEDVNNKSIKYIYISRRTILTPLAQDLINDYAITVKYSEDKNDKVVKDVWNINSTDKIAVLSNFFNEAYKIKTKEILRKIEKNVECISPKNFTEFEFNKSLHELINCIKSGKYKSAIIIHNNSFQLAEDLRKNQNIGINICWEINENKGCSRKSKFLIINSDLIGFKNLEEKIKIWIEYNK